MSTTIPQAFVQQFDDTLRLRAQQEESRLQKWTEDRGNITGESFTANMLGTVDELDEDNVRHGDTVWSDIEHSTPIALMKDFYKAFPVDRADEPKLLVNPNGSYMDRLVQAKNLRVDKMIYDAARGTANRKDGTSVVLPTSQKIAHGSTTFTKAKAVQTKKLFRTNEADEYNGREIVILFNSEMMEDLLSDTTLTSADFNTLRMLQAGDIGGKWLGMNWVPYERLFSSGGVYYTVAFAMGAIHFGTGFIEGKAQRRADKKDALQVSMAASFGAVRAEEIGVVEIAFQ